MPDESSEGLSRLVRELKSFDPEGKYYSLTLTARSGQITYSVQSHFIGFSKRNPRWEMRAPSLVDPLKITGLWKSIKQGWVTVHSSRHMAAYIRLGGNAIVDKSFADETYPSVFTVEESVHDGEFRYGGAGFLSTSRMPRAAAVNRAPSRKERMAVLKRDFYRCTVCGRRPRDYTDLELAVHHIMPWEMAGPTHCDNLTTLCGTCHKGLEPHYQPRLREFADVPGPVDPIDFSGDEFKRGVREYRELVAEALKERRANNGPAT